MLPTDRLLKVLDAIEDAEARFLAWSLTNESWTRQQLLDVIRVSCADEPEADIFRQLLEANLIGEIPFSVPPRYRSRMAETVRLLVSLRQQFPRRNWRAAPSLVADFRFRHAPRRFPRRNLDPVAALERFAALPQVTPSRLAQFRRVIGERHLSAFQVDATMRVIEAVTARADRGVVVGAGTGSGKTLSFYLPALSLIADADDAVQGTRVVAIYPRNELLKDQLASALEEARRLRAAGGPQVRIGAYFGPCPSTSKAVASPTGWPRRREGHLCPYLTCRASRHDAGTCNADLVWSDDDRKAGVERLTCTRCGDTVTDDEFALTRNSMQANPPSVVFTTTEMLNRSLSDGWSMHVFGCGPRATRPPDLVLLDEVHTYAGVNGAQVAFLLRRWRQAIGRPVAMVGLSATLANAESFFSDLTGIPEDFVTEVTPHPDDMIEQGRSYQIVLRGDPASQTALLSTSIQSIMLLERMLDPIGRPSPSGAYGNKLFAFCDNLDLVNRLYRQVLSAEGRTPFNKPDPAGFMLAGLRLAEVAELTGAAVNWAAREPDGQYWWFAERIGCGTAPLSIGRTSSQDSGVLKDANVIVATASLEVGFDDPTVGAVLQHKAPRDEAQFLQRVGRAGRTQSQRPWTAVVLSDFGRDRAAYLDYEQLLDPVVPPKSLPIGNQAVRKMQAVFAFMDWAAIRLNVAGATRSALRKYFAEPVDDEVGRALLELVTSVLKLGRDFDAMTVYLRRALRLGASEVDALLWDQPRPLMLEVLPTLHRRLVTGWGRYTNGGTGLDRSVRDHPLPEYAPRSLFDDLLLPEVQVVAPDGYNAAADTTMPVVQALTELAPGSVSLRWAVTNVAGLWSAIDTAADGIVEVGESYVAAHELLGSVRGLDGAADVPLVRPLVMTPSKPGPGVDSSSSALLNWEVEIDADGAPLEISRPSSGRLVSVLTGAQAYLHAAGGPLRIRRYSRSVSTNLLIDHQRIRGMHRFVLNGTPVAVGFETRVDGVRFLLQLHPVTETVLLGDQRRLRQLRRDLFHDRCSLEWAAVDVDDFLGSRIVEAALAIVALETTRGQSVGSLQHHAAAWWGSKVGEVIDELLLLSDEIVEGPPLKVALSAALGSEPVAAVVRRHLLVLGQEPSESWQPWLRDRLLNTIAAAIQAASQNLCTEFDFDSEVTTDVWISDDRTEVVLSDVTIGGGGPIEALVRRISEDPRRFDNLVLSALEPSDLEEADRSLSLVLDLLHDVDSLAARAARVRACQRDERLAEWRNLVADLGLVGVDVSHATTSALSARVFRPGSSADSDAVLRSVLHELEQCEVVAGFAFGQQLGALVASRLPGLAERLGAVIERDVEDSLWCQLVLRGLLWSSAEERRSTSMPISNRFIRGPRRTERTLLLDSIGSDLDSEDLDVSDVEWRATLTRVLNGAGRARLVSRQGAPQLRDAIVALAVEPLDAGWMFVYPRVEQFRRTRTGAEAVIVLEEAVQ